ncbi:MAG: hypothetical protein WAW20_03585, partial [Anaerolineae bacterium]
PSSFLIQHSSFSIQPSSFILSCLAGKGKAFGDFGNQDYNASALHLDCHLEEPLCKAHRVA